MKENIEKLIKWIEGSLDWCSKVFNRLKGLGFIIALVCLIIFISVNGCQKRHAELLIEKITGLNVRNDILQQNNKELDKKLADEKLWRELYEQKFKELDSEKERLEKENTKLRNKLSGISDWLLNITADSSYSFLTKIAYPYPGDLKFRFNEPQVKGIHKSYLENTLLTTLVDTLQKQVDNCEARVETKDLMYISANKSIEMMEDKQDNFNQIVGNYAEKEDLYIKEVNKLKRQKFFYKVTTGIGIALALIIAL